MLQPVLCCNPCCDVLLQVGVDLNVVAKIPWMAAPLQFVPGLGPRKARAVLEGVRRKEFAACRKELVVPGIAKVMDLRVFK